MYVGDFLGMEEEGWKAVRGKAMFDLVLPSSASALLCIAVGQVVCFCYLFSQIMGVDVVRGFFVSIVLFRFVEVVSVV